MLNQLFGSRLRAKLVTWMMLHRDERYFVRQIALLLKEESKNVSVELARLTAMGLLKVRQEGRQKYYQANVSCPVFTELRGLVLKTAGLGDVLKNALKPLAHRLRVVFIFGSFVKGDETTESDIDLFILGDTGLKEISAVLAPAGRQLRREINPVIYVPQEFRKKIKERQHFATHLLKEKKFFLIGGENDLKEFAG